MKVEIITKKVRNSENNFVVVYACNHRTYHRVTEVRTANHRHITLYGYC